MFEGFVNRQRKESGEPSFEHEDMSAAILKHLLHRNGKGPPYIVAILHYWLCSY
jgi:hypothetical protein